VEFLGKCIVEMNSGWEQPWALSFREESAINFKYLGQLLYFTRCIQNVFYTLSTFLDPILRVFYLTVFNVSRYRNVTAS
jgi:hypothetical protein